MLRLLSMLLLVFGWQSLAHVRMLVWWIMVMPWVVLPHAQAVWQRAIQIERIRA